MSSRVILLLSIIAAVFIAVLSAITLLISGKLNTITVSGISLLIAFFAALIFNLVLYIIFKTPMGKNLDINEKDEVENILLTRKDEFSPQQKIEELEKLAQYRKEFLGNVSHELKTPIFNIQGYLETLLDGGIHDEKVNVEYLNKAAKNVERLSNIVKDLEQISKYESGNLKLELEEYDILEQVKDVFESNEMKAHFKNISLQIKPTAHKEISVLADSEKIRQVLNNLILNAINYGKENGHLKVGIVEDNESIIVEVEDNGIGIRQDALPRIFERFYRIDSSRSREMGGTGLGLAIVKHIIEAHGQKITVRSKEGEGTTFSFSLRKA